MEPPNKKEPTTTDLPSSQGSMAPTRPSTLDLPTISSLDGDGRSPALSSLQTPLLEELQPFLRSEVEKILQQLKASPQTPGTFLNPKFVTEEQEQFANAFQQKLNELKEQSCASAMTTNISPGAAVLGANGLYVNLAEVDPKQLPNFAELCRQASQQDLASTSTPIFLYSPGTFDPRALTTHHLTPAIFGGAVAGSGENSQPSSCHSQTVLPQSVSIAFSHAGEPCAPGTTAIHLPVGLRIGIAHNTNEQTSLQSGLNDTVIITNPTQNNPTEGYPTWPLHVQTSCSQSAESTVMSDGMRGAQATSQGNDTRPSSVANSIEPCEGGAIFRSSSSVSSSSSISPNAGHNATSRSGLKDARLDLNEQSRLRLERKRARNRDAARKCRERKIRLIKSLEKDVAQLSEENKNLKAKLSRSRIEVERLKLFVVNHLEKDCPILAGKVA